MEHLNPGQLCLWTAVLEHHGKVDGFCEILREQPCQILVVGICDILLDGFDLLIAYV